MSSTETIYQNAQNRTESMTHSAVFLTIFEFVWKVVLRVKAVGYYTKLFVLMLS